MNRKKKTLIAVAAAVVLLPVLAGCGGGFAGDGRYGTVVKKWTPSKATGGAYEVKVLLDRNERGGSDPSLRYGHYCLSKQQFEALAVGGPFNDPQHEQHLLACRSWPDYQGGDGSGYPVSNATIGITG